MDNVFALGMIAKGHVNNGTLSTWYHSKPFPHRKPEGLDAQPSSMLARTTQHRMAPKPSYSRSKSFLSSSIVCSGPVTE
jgi:hypothetical protein